MKTLKITLDGHDYYVRNADDSQLMPEAGDTIVDAAGQEVALITCDESGEYWLVLELAGGMATGAYARVHENEHDALLTAIGAVLLSVGH